MKDMGARAIMPDPLKPVGPPADDEKRPPLGRKLLWFAALALAGLLAVAGAAYLLRALLFIG